ncbi:MAG: PASTA domain-containing protein, partial [Bacilli bacterium]|nr:PASTA domain-containing protein [Bacilli bacterium]
MSKEFLNEINAKETNENESFQKEKFEKIKPDRTKYFVLAFVFISLIIVSLFFMNPKVTLENLVGMNISDAKTWALNNDVQLIQKDVYAPMETGLILSQSIEAGTEVKAKSTVSIEVSLGFDPNEVISLPTFDESWTKTKILAWLDEQKLENFTLTYEEREDIEPNLYLSHELPETSGEFLRSQSITFSLSALPVEEEISVVDFLNFSTAQIDAWAKDNEIIIQYATAYSDTIQTNKVVRQSISAGTILNPKDKIIVTLSKGPAIKIVDFAPYGESSANAWAKENSIDLTIIKEYSSTVVKDVAIYQSIPKDTVVETGTDLTLYYSLGSVITVPSYVNQAFTNLQNFVETQNENKAQLILNVEYSHSADVA